VGASRLSRDPAALASAVGGESAPAIVADGQGGAIVAWLDKRLATTDIFAQHLLANGMVDPAWPANGVAFNGLPGGQGTFAMVSDGASGAIVAWADRREGETNLDIYAGHVLSSGALDPRWPHHGVPLCIASGSQDLVAITVPAGPGGTGAIVTWQDPRPGSLGFDVYAQRILNSGVLGTGWPANGRAVCTSAGDQTQPTI